MIRRLMQQVCLLLGCLAAASSGSLALAQPSTQRIIAVGDLHGDWEAWIAIARAAGLVDGNGRWAGGATTLVQMGDIADRGPDSLKIIEHLRGLQGSARRSGGRVIVLVGNHEAMNVIGDLRYVHPGEYAAFADRRSRRVREDYFRRNRAAIERLYRASTPAISDDALRGAFMAATPLGKIEHQRAWHPSGEIGAWAIGNPAAVKIGDTLFVHGGLSSEYGSLPLEQLNRRVSAALIAREQAPTSIISDPLGPLWYRGHITRGGEGGVATARPPIDQELDAVLRAQGVRRIVVGHTPDLAGIEVSNDGRLVRIDTGISRHYGGQLAFLEIVGGRLIPHKIDRPAAAAEARP